MFAAAGSFCGTIVSCLLCGGCRCVYDNVMLRSARAGYTVLFVATIFITFLMRDYSREAVNMIPGVHIHKDNDDVWYGSQVVYRLTFGSFLFFSVMSLILINTKYQGDKRHINVQHGNWPVKTFFWVAALIISFFIPGDMKWFEWMARIGSGFYLVVQTVILLDFVYALNDAWFAQGEQSKIYLYAMLVTVIGLYALHGVFIGLGFHFFKPDGAGACSLNVSLLVWTTLATLMFSIMSVSEVFPTGSLFPSSAISVYCGFLCFSALQSEPNDYDCNGLAHKDTAKGSSVALGLCITLLAVVYSALRAGSTDTTIGFARSDDEEAQTSGNQESLLTSAGQDGQPSTTDQSTAPRAQETSRNDNKEAIDDFKPVLYNYSFFHLIFSLASLYVAMLFTEWGTEDNDSVQVGVSWTSVWVKLASQIFTALLYTWTLAAPVFFPDREFA